MPFPDNFLSDADEQRISDLLDRHGGREKRACPDARCARLVNGKIMGLPPAGHANTSAALRRDVIRYSAGGVSVNQGLPLQNVIAVILESPHKEEFKGGTIAPAMGRTGRRFFDHFDKLFAASKCRASVSASQQYDLVFMNSVQYQASCGKPLSLQRNKMDRDSNWIEIFTNWSDLDRRILSINPFLVINLCTKGKCGLTGYVGGAVGHLCRNYTTGNHPSYWFNGNARIN